jgi:hypothetical protein
VINPAETDGHRPTAEELARLLAHDLRTPLNAVRGFADLLLVGAAGPLTAAAAGLVAEVARAGRALEVSIGLAQELAEPPTARALGRCHVELRVLLDECGFDVAPGTGTCRVAAAVPGDPAAWRRLLRACHAHLTGDTPAVRPSVTIGPAADGHLELNMGSADIEGRALTSVLRERLIRQTAADVGASIVAVSPHLLVTLRVGEAVCPSSGGDEKC